MLFLWEIFAATAIALCILLGSWLYCEVTLHDETQRALDRRDKALDELLSILQTVAFGGDWKPPVG